MEAVLLLAVALVTTLHIINNDKSSLIVFMKQHLLEIKVLKQIVGFLQSGF